MTKWEYLNLTYMGESSDDTKATIVKINGKVIYKDSWKPINIYDYINQLGKDGWELVAVNGWVLNFKRPLEVQNG